MRIVDSLWSFAWRNHRKLTLGLFIEWIILIMYGVVSYLYMAEFIQQMINRSLVLTPKSDLFELWKNPPVQPEMRIYLFNYTNVQEWINGSAAKLHVEQLGPYVYQELWLKRNVTFDSQGQVSYDLFKEYHYSAEKSKGNAMEDLIFTPNIPMFAAGSSMKDANYFSLMGFKATINAMIGNEKLPVFVQKSVHELIWGYDDKLTELGMSILLTGCLIQKRTFDTAFDQAFISQLIVTRFSKFQLPGPSFSSLKYLYLRKFIVRSWEMH